MRKRTGIFYGLIFLFLLFPLTAQARVVEDVQVQTLPDGYEIVVRFLFAIQYQSHTPQDQQGKEFYVQLKTTNFQTLTDQEVDTFRERVTLGWNEVTGIPLKEMTFEGGDPERPQMTFLFIENVEFDVRSSADLRSLIVRVKTEKPPAVVPEETKKTLAVEKVFEEAAKELPGKSLGKKGEEISLPEIVPAQDPSVSNLMEEARDSLTKGDYNRAVQLYTKILQSAHGAVKQQAQELLGVARERNGQLAHAKAEYEKYIQEFPLGSDADRIRQRLAGLVTAAKPPKERLKESKRAAKRETGWSSQYFGNLSQFFFRDQTIPEGGETQVNRYDLSSDLDLNSRWKREGFNMGARFTGGYQNNFLEGEDNEKSISALSFDMRSQKKNLYGRFGRQSLSSGGVLGRFDGTHLSANIAPQIKINGVFGYPVESVHQTEIEPDKKFYGVNFDLGTFLQKWDFNTFFIDQTNSGLTDRRAIGGEVRYFDPSKAFFTLMDYDVFFNVLNIFLCNGHWTLPTKTTLNLALDYRKSPLLVTNNAIQGQGAGELSDLSGRFTDAQIKQLAEDRTTNSKSVTFGVTQDLKQDLQLATEATVSELEGTVTSGGVDGAEGTGQDYFYSTQLIASNVLREGDVVITGLNFSDTARYHTYSLNLNGRFPLTRKIRFIPKLRLDYRDAKESGDNRVTVRPIMRVDYNFNRWMRFEVEAGIEWLDEKTSGMPQKSTETFISAGYRLNF